MNKELRNYGILGGLIGAIFFAGPIAIFTDHYLDPGNFGNSEVVGFSVMFLSMVPVFLGTRAYRNKYFQDSAFSFGKGLVSSLIITGIATLVFYIGNVVVYEVLAPDFLSEFSPIYYDYMVEQATTEAEKAKIMAEFESFKPYANNGFLYGIVMSASVLIFGLIISLISALTLKRAV